MKDLTRRQVMKGAAVGAGVTAAAGIGLPFVIRETPALFEKNDSFWAEGFKDSIANDPELDQDLDVDVAVIGGGYTGLSAAWHLAMSDSQLKIIVLEGGLLGSGASGRNGGMVLSQIGPESFEIADDLETHVQTYNLTVAGMQSMKKLVASTSQRADLELGGFVHGFLDEDDFSYYKEYVDRVRQAGMPLRLWNVDEVAESLGTERFAGGVYDPNGGSVHPMKLVHALREACIASGVKIFQNSPVTEIAEGETVRLMVGANPRTVRAKSVVLGTGAYTSKLGYFKNEVVPVHTTSAATNILTAEQLEQIGWESKLPFFDSRNLVYHLVLTADNRIVIGGGEARYFFRNNLKYSGNISESANEMLDELIKFYPALEGVEMDYVWSGILDTTFDERPAAGVTGKHNNIYYGLGYSGEGVNMSFVFGQVIAALHQGKDHPWLNTRYANMPFSFMPPEPYRWLGANSLLWYYDRQDQE